MDYDGKFAEALDGLRAEGRYRVPRVIHERRPEQDEYEWNDRKQVAHLERDSELHQLHCKQRKQSNAYPLPLPLAERRPQCAHD